jgi:hypothetical protein
MDVRRLEHVDDHGLKQCRPVMRAAFPLARADVEPSAPGPRTSPTSASTVYSARSRSAGDAPSASITV